MSKFRKDETVQDVEFEEIESIEEKVKVEGEVETEKTDKKKKGFMPTVKTVAKKSGKIVVGFALGIATAVGVGVLLNRDDGHDSDEDEVYYLEDFGGDETDEEDDSEE